MERLLHTQLEREQEKRALEIRMLQNQLNPHFLYNTLNTIKLMAALQGKTAIQNMIEALGRLLRANLSAGEEQIRLSQELDMLDSYLSSRIRPKGRFTSGEGDFRAGCAGIPGAKVSASAGGRKRDCARIGTKPVGRDDYAIDSSCWAYAAFDCV